MNNKVLLISNPYEKTLRIFINDKPVSEYSNLVQYMDEPFMYWKSEILMALYEECNRDKFTLYFKSSDDECEIMSYYANFFSGCSSYVPLKHERYRTLDKRIKRLNSLLRTEKITGYHRYRRDIIIISNLSCEIIEEIKTLTIDNYIASMPIKMISIDEYVISNNQYNHKAIIAILNKNDSRCSEIPFVIWIGRDNKFIKDENGTIFYESSISSIKNTIKTFLNVSIYSDMFYHVMDHMPEPVRRKEESELRKLTSISPIIEVDIESRLIEEGHSVSIKFKSDVANAVVDLSNLIFKYKDPSIISCNGLRISGLSEGETTLYIYMQGERKPFFEKSFSVIKRRRIQNITLSQNSLLLGEGDNARLDFSYTPSNADNASSIKWITDRDNVVNVFEGNIRALSEGKAVIMCVAEQVSATCTCEVRPYLKEIEIPSLEIILPYGGECEIVYSVSPYNAIDAQINFTSMNMQIANIIGRKIQGVGIGDTKIFVANSTKRITKTIDVHVISEKKYKKIVKKTLEKKEGGWFSKLKGLFN